MTAAAVGHVTVEPNPDGLVRVSRHAGATDDALGVHAFDNDGLRDSTDAVRLKRRLVEHIDTLQATEKLKALETGGLLLVRRNLTVLDALTLDQGGASSKACSR